MPSYRVVAKDEKGEVGGIGDSVTLLKALGERFSDSGEVIGYEHQSVTYPLGAVIPASEISPVVLQDYANGDERLRRLIELVDDVEVVSDTVEEEAPAEEPVEEEIAEEESDEPIEGYDNMAVAQVIEALQGADQDLIDAVKAYEETHKGRTTVLNYEPDSESNETED